MARRETFERHVRLLRTRIDEEGVISNPADFREQIDFFKAHAAEFRDEIRHICLERGFAPVTDQLVAILSHGLSEEEQQELFKRSEAELEDLLRQTPDRKLDRGQLLVQIIGDAGRPIGLRSNAIWQFRRSSADWSSPALIGQTLSLLDTVKEPYLRTWLFSEFLGQGGDDKAVTSAVIERGMSALASEAERRGTLEVVISRLGTYLQAVPGSQGVHERFAPRIDAAIAAFFLREAGRAEPDELVLGKVARALYGRRSLPTAEQIARAAPMLKPEATSCVRLAAVALPVPDIREKETPAARAHIATCRPLLMEALRTEKHGLFAEMAIGGLAQWRDTEAERFLDDLERERPDLRDLIQSRRPRRK